MERTENFVDNNTNQGLQFWPKSDRLTALNQGRQEPRFLRDGVLDCGSGYIWRNWIMSEIKKVVLAYSGGLDTSIIIPWLKENYNNPEIIAVSGDVGQGAELDGLEEKAIKTGASKLYVLDLKKDYVENYIWPCLKMFPLV